MPLFYYIFNVKIKNFNIITLPMAITLQIFRDNQKKIESRKQLFIPSIKQKEIKKKILQTSIKSKKIKKKCRPVTTISMITQWNTIQRLTSKAFRMICIPSKEED